MDCPPVEWSEVVPFLEKMEDILGAILTRSFTCYN